MAPEQGGPMTTDPVWIRETETYEKPENPK